MLRVLLALGVFALPLRAAAPPLLEQWIVVLPSDFREAVSPLIEHRRAQGLRVEVLSQHAFHPQLLLADLHKLCRSHVGKSRILLVGPVPSLHGSISRMKGEPTDAPYGCLNGTRLPTVAIGRFPARTIDECKAMVAKTLILERDRAPGAWRHRLTVLAGIPAYNPVVDRMVENIAFARFDKLHPRWTGKAIYTASQSRFTLPDAQLRTKAIDYVQEGQAIILYLGHSSAEGLYARPTAAFPDRNDWAKVKIKTGSVFITFGCNGCQLAGRDGEGYGLYAMRNPQGPVAVLGSHGICFAAMVQLACDGLFERAFQGSPPRRLGDCWLAALEGVAKGKIDFLSYRMLDSVDGDTRIPQATQRQEHLEMFVLLGDPALRLPQIADDIAVSVEKEITPGKPIVVQGRLPERLRNATVRLSLERSAGSVPTNLKSVAMGGERDKVILDNHDTANRFAVVTQTIVAREDTFETRLNVPAKLPWPRLTLRIYAHTSRDEAMDVHNMEVRAEPDVKERP